MTENPTPITCIECAKLIGVSLPTLSRLVKAKAIPFYRVGVGPKAGVRFQKEAVLAWMARGGVRGKVHVSQNGKAEQAGETVVHEGKGGSSKHPKSGRVQSGNRMADKMV